MEHLTQAWISLLNEQTTLLDELMVALRQEREALLHDQVDQLKAATLVKEKSTRKLELNENKTKILLRRSCELLGLPQIKKLANLFEFFSPEDRKILQEHRLVLSRKMKNIKSHNQSMGQFLNIFIREVEDIQSALGLNVSQGISLYGSRGGQKTMTSSGRFIDRSL